MKGLTGDQAGGSSAARLVSTMLHSDGNVGGAWDEGLRLVSEALELGVDALLVLRAIHNDVGEIVDFQIVELNQKGAALLGVPRDAARSRLLGEVAPATREEGAILRYASIMREGKSTEHDYYAAPGGLLQIWIRQRIVPLSEGVAVFTADVSEQRRVTEAAERTRRVLEKIAAATPDLHAIWDPESRRFAYHNDNFNRLLGYEPTGREFSSLLSIESVLHPDDLEKFKDHVAALASRESDDVLEANFRCRSATGSYRWLRFRDSVFERFANSDPRMIFFSAQDVTRHKTYEAELEDRMAELKRAREELELTQRELEEQNIALGKLAVTDSLTGLKNHRAFKERLVEEVDRALRYNQKLALVLADVDGFKGYNDRYGHPAGDDALRAFAKVLNDVSRSSDLVVRYGGEEFGLILPNTSAEEAAHLAERIRASLRATKFGDQGITASFGCAEVRPGREADDRLVSDADQALYKSKHAGRDQVTVYLEEA